MHHPSTEYLLESRLSVRLHCKHGESDPMPTLLLPSSLTSYLLSVPARSYVCMLIDAIARRGQDTLPFPEPDERLFIAHHARFDITDISHRRPKYHEEYPGALPIRQGEQDRPTVNLELS